MPHAIWKGNISFGLVNIPVGLYSAEKRHELSFTQLDKEDLAPVGYRKYNKKSGKEVPTDQIVKGYEYEDGHYVIMQPEDFRRANPEATQTVDIVDFVDASEIHPVFFEKPYYLAPIGKAAKGYALLRETMKRSGKIGIANVVIHTRAYLAAVVPQGKMLILNILRFPTELRDAADLEVPGEDLSTLGVTEKELSMAETLVNGMVEKWDPKKYHDKYRDDILALIQHRIETGQIETVTEPPPPEAKIEGAEVIDLMALLKKSIENTEKTRRQARG